MKVVAIDPTDPDSTDVLESNEVAFNGGVSRSYPPTILRLSSDYGRLRFFVDGRT